MPTDISQSFCGLTVEKYTCQLYNKNNHFHEHEARQSLKTYWYEKPVQNCKNYIVLRCVFLQFKKSHFCFCCTLSKTSIKEWKWIFVMANVNSSHPSSSKRLLTCPKFLEWKEMECSLNKGFFVYKWLKQLRHGMKSSDK